MIEKDLGKLTHDQFAKLVSRLPEVRGEMEALPALLREKKDRLHTILAAGKRKAKEVADQARTYRKESDG